ncbi:MAG: Trk system potassium transporter TrkA [Peptococcaceae bacterium]|nr:Trk system potassium transporter TrkA [Peptococcaceae bacterium]
MHVVIVGVGKIGSIICRELVDAHDVVVIEKNPDILDAVINSTDVSGIVGSGVEYDTLMSAGADHCDVFIAVTAHDEINMIACIFAKRMGAKYTIARVREHEYMLHQEFMRESVGVDAIINPEGESAHQIISLLRFPSTTQVESFLRGRVNIVEYPLPESHPFVGLSLIELQQQFKGHILVCIVERDGKAIIPKGDFILQSGDVLHISGTSNELQDFFRRDKVLSRKKKIRSVMIVGGGRLTHYVLNEMQRTQTHYHVKVLENDRQKAEILAQRHPEVEVVLADGSNYRHLEEEGLTTYDCLIALTGIDEENILIAMYAHKRGLKRYITKVNRTELLEILGEDRLKAIITPGKLIADTIVRLTRAMDDARGKDVEALYRLVDNQVEALQFFVPSGSKVLGKALRDLPIKNNVLIAAIMHNGVHLFPSGNDMLHIGDIIIVTTTDHSLRSIDDILEKE